MSCKKCVCFDLYLFLQNKRAVKKFIISHRSFYSNLIHYFTDCL
ncbi:hypothetical protein HMPREF9096_01632 [Haemophilus sp. oral taxon 851 str. F0397]|nr:hypothetical protein HMPREF9096_01632 [Haemophilus sp. oral taxon 851 str. F0397]